MRYSIRARLILVFIGLAVGPLLVVGIILAWQSFTILEQQALTLQQEAAKRVTSQVAAFFQKMENELSFTIQTQRLLGLDQDRQRSVLSNLLAYESAFDELHLLNGQGQEQVGLYRTSLASTATVDRSQADEFVIPKTTGQVYYGPVGYDQTTGEPHMTIAIPMFNLRTGSLDGVLVSVARIKTVWDLIAGIEVSQGQSIYIVAADGRVVAHRNPSVVLRGSTLAVPKQNGIQPGLSGERVVLASDTMSLGQQQFSIVAEQAVSEALALAFNTILIIAGLVLAALAIAIALGLPIVRQIVQPIQTMGAAAQAISTGDLSQQIRVTRQDELGVLANAFNSMTNQLRELIAGLEHRVAERTADLERRSAYLQASAEVGRAVGSILDVDVLTTQVVKLIQERFGLYYVGLFLTVPAGEWAVLRAGTGEAGRAMLARGHRVQVGHGMVGWSIAHAQARVAMQAEADAVRVVTPELPETRSEAALPLRSRGQVLGALTVQSAEAEAFDPDAVAVLQTMADQVASVLDNARLFAESQSALEAERRAYGEVSRRAWLELARSQAGLGYVCDREDTPSRAPGSWQPGMVEASRTGQPVIAPGEGGRDLGGSTLAIPVKIGEQVEGAVRLRKPQGARPWTPDEVKLMETLAGQLGTALESARLYRDTQRRAAQERLVGEVTARMRQTLDVDTVLDTAVDEIARVLGLEALDLRVGTVSLAEEAGVLEASPAPPEKSNRRDKTTGTAPVLRTRRGKRQDGDSK